MLTANFSYEFIYRFCFFAIKPLKQTELKFQYVLAFQQGIARQDRSYDGQENQNFLKFLLFIGSVFSPFL